MNCPPHDGGNRVHRVHETTDASSPVHAVHAGTATVATTRINRFLCAVWSRQAECGYGVIARKANGWAERALYVNGRIPKVCGTGVCDLYFTPCLFSAPDHRSQHALPSRWLYADLDEADPRALPSELKPTLAWRTSPNRFQALWLLDRPLERRAFEDLNQKLTYLIGADHTGWDASQLLRLPGSVSTKYGTDHKVVLLPGHGPSYRSQDIAALVRHVQVTRATAAGHDALPAVLPRVQDVRAKWLRRLRPTDRRLLTTTEPVSDRSGHLHHLYPRLFACGVTREDVYVLVSNSVLSKNGPRWLWADVCRGWNAHARYSAGDGDHGGTKTQTARERDCENGSAHG